MKRTFNIFSLAIIVSLLVSAVGLPLISARAAGGWNNVGPAGFSNGAAYYTSLAINNSTPYVAFGDESQGSRVSVMKFNGTAWVNVGPAGFSSDVAAYTSLVFDNSTPYVAYSDYGNGGKASVMKFNGTAWVNVGPAGFSSDVAAYPSLAFDNGTPYLAFSDQANSSQASVMRFNGTAWVNVGSAGLFLSSASYPSLVFDNGVPYVAFSDWTNGFRRVSVMKFNGTAWVNVGSAGFSPDSASYTSLAFNNGIPYVAFTGYVNGYPNGTNRVSVMKFDAPSGNWVYVGIAGFTQPGANYISLAFDNGAPYVAFGDSSNGSKANVWKFDAIAGSWVNVGTAGFSSGQAYSISLAFDQDTPYVAFRDESNSGKVSVMKFAGGVSSTCFPLIVGHTGQGMNPTVFPANSIGCPTGQYAAGATINLSDAYVDSGWRVAGWTGTNNDSSTMLTNTLTMPASARTVTVNYSLVEYTLTFTSAHGTVTKNPDKPTYHYGDVVQLTATPDPDWLFVNWSGGNLGTVNTASIIVQSNWSITANFAPQGTHTWYVATSGSDDNSCDTPASPCENINIALGKASPGDTVKVAEGIYTKQLYDFNSWIVDIQTGATILGGWNASFTQQGVPSIIDGENGYWGIDNAAANVTLSGFIIRNAAGVGIVNGGMLTLDKISVINTNGVGIENGGILMMQNTTISQSKGSGLRNDEGSVTVKNSTITNNQVDPASSEYGGGIRIVHGTVTLSNSIISANSAPQSPDCFVNTINSSIVSNGYNIIGNTGGCAITPEPGDKFNTDPLLLPLSSAGYQPLSLGSPARDTGNDADCPATDQRGVTRPHGSHCDMGAYEYDKKNGSDTTGVFRPSNGYLFMKNTNLTGFADWAFNYGLSGDYPVVGDWDGNGTVTLGVYRAGKFYLRNDNTNGFADMVIPFGQVGDQPVAGDWDGDGVDTIGVYSKGTFLLRNSNDAGAAEMTFQLGNPGDVGVAGDWNGDGKDTTGVFRPSNGVIFLKDKNESGFADIALNYGLPGDKPVTGDWNNDGKDTIGVYRQGQFMLRNENTNGFAEIIFGLGNSGDMPIAGNWDGLP